jgi:hypothetical protein
MADLQTHRKSATSPMPLLWTISKSCAALGVAPPASAEGRLTIAAAAEQFNQNLVAMDKSPATHKECA